MPFVFVRYAAIFCGVALLLALCAELAFWLALAVAAHFSSGGVGVFYARRGWLFLFALWWLISFVISVPLARKFVGLRFPLL
jgi:hypothetical protein